ncbi:MAG: TIGR00341 family protein [Deltaproteobacteria bacterium]|nr:TIGR00341 family protein [Candidatus Zymogenaceae bacterium]
MSRKKDLKGKLKDFFGFTSAPPDANGSETPRGQDSDENKILQPDAKDDDRGAPDDAPRIDWRHGLTDMMGRVIRDDEKTLKNYASIRFWKKKRDEYISLKTKEQEDLNVYQALSQAAQPNLEYYILIILSSVIASAGLIQGSTAAVIGAMIVAPLMTPILSFAIAILWGDLSLIRTSVSSIVRGTLIAVVISAVIARLIPFTAYSAEIMARTKPSLYDIIVALAAGIVGAYGYANRKVSSTIVGIAIAVALVPPLCTIGIGIGDLNWKIAGGAATLYLINLVAISLAGSVVFWWMKIQPLGADTKVIKRRALLEIITAVVILLAIAIPLGLYTWETYRLDREESAIVAQLRDRLPQWEITEIMLTKNGTGRTLTAVITGPDTPSASELQDLKWRLLKDRELITEIRVRYIHSTNY